MHLTGFWMHRTEVLSGAVVYFDVSMSMIPLVVSTVLALHSISFDAAPEVGKTLPYGTLSCREGMGTDRSTD
jgi:hypothetical protein